MRQPTLSYVLLILTSLLVASVAVPAQACELVCLKTVALYDGNLGGIAGADAKCAAEFPGFKFPRASSLLDLMIKNSMAISNGSSSVGFGAWWGISGYLYNAGSYNTYYAWSGAVASGPLTAYNCTNWTSNSSGYYGGSIWQSTYYGSNTQPSYSYPANCNYQLPLVCCNM